MADGIGGGGQIDRSALEGLRKAAEKLTPSDFKLPENIKEILQNDSFALRELVADGPDGFSKEELSTLLQTTYDGGEGISEKIAEYALSKAGGQINSGQELVNALGIEPLEISLNEKIQDLKDKLTGGGDEQKLVDVSKVDLLKFLIKIDNIELPELKPGGDEVDISPSPRVGRGGGGNAGGSSVEGEGRPVGRGASGNAGGSSVEGESRPVGRGGGGSAGDSSSVEEEGRPVGRGGGGTEEATGAPDTATSETQPTETPPETPPAETPPSAPPRPGGRGGGGDGDSPTNRTGGR